VLFVRPRGWQLPEKHFFVDRGKCQAAELFDRITTSDQFAEFLTLPGYEQLD